MEKPNDPYTVQFVHIEERHIRSIQYYKSKEHGMRFIASRSEFILNVKGSDPSLRSCISSVYNFVATEDL